MSNLSNAKYYLEESMNPSNELDLRKESCEIAKKNFLNAQKKENVNCERYLELCNETYKEIGKQYFESAMGFFGRAVDGISDNIYQMQQEKEDDLNRALELLKNAKDCGYTQCDKYIKRCNFLLLKGKKEIEKENNIMF